MSLRATFAAMLGAPQRIHDLEQRIAEAFELIDQLQEQVEQINSDDLVRQIEGAQDELNAVIDRVDDLEGSRVEADDFETLGERVDALKERLDRMEGVPLIRE